MKIVLTGSSSGIGLALYGHLTSQGHQVWGWSRRPLPTQKSSACDVSHWEQVRAAAQTIGKEWGSCDAVICASGIQGAIGLAMENDPSEWARTISVNLNGTYFSLRALYPLLQARGGRGKAVCFSGGGATSPRPYFSAYAAAKTGVVRLVETVAKECAGQLDINAVAPGAIHTAMTDEVLRLGPEIVGEADFLAAQKTKVQGAEAMQKVLRLVDYLLSPQSDGLSGKLLSAPWDKWESLEPNRAMESDIFTLRRVT